MSHPAALVRWGKDRIEQFRPAWGVSQRACMGLLSTFIATASSAVNRRKVGSTCSVHRDEGRDGY